MFKNIYIMLTIALALAIVASAQDNQTDVRHILLCRFANLQNLLVDYKVTTEWLASISKEEVVQRKGEKGFLVKSTGVRVTRRELAVLEQNRLYDEHLESWDRRVENRYSDSMSVLKRQLNVFRPDRTEHLLVSKGGTDAQVTERSRGRIRDQSSLPEGSIDIALGLREFGQPRLLTCELLEEMELRHTDSEGVVLSEVDSEGRTHEWIFDPKLGYGLTFYRMRVPPDNKIDIEYVMEDFRNINGVILPFKINVKWTPPGHGTTRKDSIEVSEFKINDPSNTVERYRIKWPEGATVLDTRSGIPFHIKGGKMVYAGENKIDKMILDEVDNVPVGIMNTSAYSSDTNEPNEVVATIENKPANLPVGDLVPILESGKFFSTLWKLAVVFILTVAVVGAFVYSKRGRHTE